MAKKPGVGPSKTRGKTLNMKRKPAVTIRMSAAHWHVYHPRATHT
jgi:hypothetical protein